MSNISQSKNGKFLIPTVISAFLPGVGQLIKGHIKKGIAIIGIGLIWGIVNWLLGWVWGIGWIIGAIGIVGWIANLIDAYISKKDIKSFDKFLK